MADFVDWNFDRRFGSGKAHLGVDADRLPIERPEIDALEDDGSAVETIAKMVPAI